MDVSKWLTHKFNSETVQDRVRSFCQTIVDMYFPNSEYAAEKFILTYVETLIHIEKALERSYEIDHKSIADAMQHPGHRVKLNRAYLRDNLEKFENKMLSEVARQNRHFTTFLSAARSSRHTTAEPDGGNNGE